MDPSYYQNRLSFHWGVVLCVLLWIFLLPSSVSAGLFGAYKVNYTWQDVFPQADRFGPEEGTPPIVTAYRGDTPLGYAFIASKIIPSIGYSGKPIEILVGLDLQGIIVGTKLISHHEPILLTGIPEKKLFDFVGRYVGINVPKRVQENVNGQTLDAISGATVTAIVVDASIIRSSLSIARNREMAGLKQKIQKQDQSILSQTPFIQKTWDELLKEGSIHRLHLTHEDVDKAFQNAGIKERQPFEEWGKPEETFIDFYAALVTPETIGRNLLGDAEYHNFQKRSKPGQQAILLAAYGRYSFRGSGFVRGGIFDRFQMIHGDTSLLFRDKQYKRLGKVAPKGAPDFSEVGLFYIPIKNAFNPVNPWRIELLAQRFTNAVEKAFTQFHLDYTLPEIYIHHPPTTHNPTISDDGSESIEIWQQIWKNRTNDVIVLSVALILLTLAFFFQDWLVLRPKLFERFQTGFLLFSLLWIGVYAQAQLSVVNVLTFINSVITGFNWTLFLLDPLIFMLWSGVAVSLLFWGRGAYCGWLCPFGALQELLNRVACFFKVPQLKIRFRWHERLWAFKYIFFLILLAISFQSMAMAEMYAEIEPFKTVVLLRFVRGVWFVLYAVFFLVVGLFIYRFFCRYICPLGAALAIPGRVRMFEWLKRRKQCGSECQICSHECQIQAIHPEGHINPNECLYCLTCQKIYNDNHHCPPLIKGRQRLEKRIAIKKKLAAKGVIPDS